MGSVSIVCDTSIWLYLGRLNHLYLLESLYSEIYVTDEVCLELDAGRLLRPDTADPRLLTWAKQVSLPPNAWQLIPANRLGRGEQSVMICALLHQLDIVGLDDGQARQLAQRLQLKIVGTVGVLLLAKQKNLIQKVEPLLSALPQCGFYLTPAYKTMALQLAGE